MKTNAAWWILGIGGAVYLLTRRASTADAPAAPSIVGMTPAQRVEYIRRMQRVLREAGLYEGAIDGIVGAATRRAVDAWVMERPSLAARLPDGAAREAALVAAVLSRAPAERVAG